MNNVPLLMTEEYWANSQLSVVRHFGRIEINGIEFVIVNKDGKDIFECSAEAKKAGRQKAIEPGEPADLVQRELIPIYRKLGREKLIELIKAHPEFRTVKAVKDYLKTHK